MKKDKYVAHYGANNDNEEFETFDEAKEWLDKQYMEDGEDGFSEESCNGYDFIAKITHRSKFVESDNKKNYSWCEVRQGYFNSDGDEWCSEHDVVGVILIEEINSEDKEWIKSLL